jgi:tRNA (cmo5U34)-methyltransferase
MPKEKVGDSIIAENANWSFSGKVCKTFDEHVLKSVPLYKEGHDLILKVSDYFLRNESLCYDLGCSTGELIKDLSNHVGKRNVTFYGVDCEKGMVETAKKKCKEKKNVKFFISDIFDIELDKSDLIICYYTMQFVQPRNRQIMFDRIYESLNWGGGFLLFEKVRGPDARFQDMMTGIYTDYKLETGYSSNEIISKARSLKGVLEPFSSQGNIDLIKRAGFVDYMTIMKYICFEGILCIK